MISASALLILFLSSVSALTVPVAALDRRAILGRFASAATAVVALPALAITPPGSRPTFAGEFNDPQHPGCKRNIKLAGSQAIIRGADEDGTPWKVTGKVSGSEMIVDFSPKGGPKAVPAKWNGLGIQFPDGNVWTKASLIENPDYVRYGSGISSTVFRGQAADERI